MFFGYSPSFLFVTCLFFISVPFAKHNHISVTSDKHWWLADITDDEWLKVNSFSLSPSNIQWIESMSFQIIVGGKERERKAPMQTEPEKLVCQHYMMRMGRINGWIWEKQIATIEPNGWNKNCVTWGWTWCQKSLNITISSYIHNYLPPSTDKWKLHDHLHSLVIIENDRDLRESEWKFLPSHSIELHSSKESSSSSFSTFSTSSIFIIIVIRPRLLSLSLCRILSVFSLQRWNTVCKQITTRMDKKGREKDGSRKEK